MKEPTTKKRALFICTHNAARSQMAEGWLRALRGEHYEVFSAGTEPKEVSPYAMTVMAECGIDIGAHHSKSIAEFSGREFDLVITVCNHAHESCPFFPSGGKRLHRSFTDPSTTGDTHEEVMAGFRSIRDQIRHWIENEWDETVMPS